MTNEEAIRRLEHMDSFLQTRCNDYSERDHDAFLLAIQALESDRYSEGYSQGYLDGECGADMREDEEFLVSARKQTTELNILRDENEKLRKQITDIYDRHKINKPSEFDLF